MTRKSLDAEEIFNEAAEEMAWTLRKRVEVLLGFVESMDLEGELSEYLSECTDDDDTEDGEPFETEDE